MSRIKYFDTQSRTWKYADTLVDSGGGGTDDHTQLNNRDAANQHPMSAITGLEDEFGQISDAFSDVFEVLDGKLSDAPSDGKQYARQNGAWSEVTDGDDAIWGDITGTLNDQTDLKTALDGKVDKPLTAITDRITTFGNNGSIKDSGKSFEDSLSGLSAKIPTSKAVKDYVDEHGGGGDADNAVLYTPQSLTEAQKSQARDNIGAYTKPPNGIPKADLAGAVQTSLSKADKAYEKPMYGIPKSDLSSAVQESLDANSGAVRFDTTQSLTNAQKKQARDNIGAIADNGIWAVNITKNGDTYTADSNYTVIKGAVDLGLFVYAIYDDVYYYFDGLGANRGVIFSRTNIEDDEAQIQSFQIFDNSVERFISEYESVVYVDIAVNGDEYIARIKGQPASVSSIRLYSLIRLQPVVGRYVGSGGYDYFPLRTLTADTAIFTRATISNPPNTISQYGFIINDTDVSTYEQKFIPYTKPSGGIPKTHLASDVQTSLNNADNAVLYAPQGLTDEQKAQARANIGAGTGSGETFDINALTQTNSLSNSDTFPFYDASATGPRKTTWSNIKSKLKTYFDDIYLTEHQSLADYASKAWVEAKGYITSLAGYATEAWVTAKGYGTYSLPAGGIPENQLAAEVQTKLNSSAGLDYITYDSIDHPSGGRTRRCRRWNSGLQEHWYSIPMNNVAINTAFGSMFRSEFEGNHAYMKAFVSGDADGNPISEVSWQAASGSNPAFTWMVDPTDVTGSTSSGPGTPLSMTPKFGLVRPDNTTVSGIATIYTRGYWKTS